MTREEAKRIVEKHCGLPLGQGNIVDVLELLGLLKFDEAPKKEENVTCLFSMHSILGMIRLEEWETGLVLWVGGLIVWQSWKEEAPKKDVNRNIFKCGITMDNLSALDRAGYRIVSVKSEQT